MGDRWTLHIEDFGRIRRADITPAPLTLFVGDNNSGKSYLMTLLYELVGFDFGTNINTPEYQCCAEFLQNAVEKARAEGKPSVSLSDSDVLLFQDLLNRTLRDGKNEYLQHAFNTDRVTAGGYSLTVPGDRKFTMTVPEPVYSSSFRRAGENRLSSAITLSVEIAGQSGRRQEIFAPGKDWVSACVLEIILNLLPWSMYPVFLPVSRTGFLLNRREIAAKSVSLAYNYSDRKKPASRLTRPCTDFLTKILNVEDDGTAEPRLRDIADFMEREMMRGRVGLSDTPFPTFLYSPDNSDVTLPMFLSSGVVTELTPLLLMLRYQMMDTLFIEEPEMCLHLSLQQRMARVLIKTARAGVPVFATTHSDTILQHVNNMIKLNSLPEDRKQAVMNEYGFENSDLISADEVAVYQFDVKEDGHTEVNALSYDEYGYFAPTFTDSLKDLLKQTRETKPAAGDEEEDED